MPKYNLFSKFPAVEITYIIMLSYFLSASESLTNLPDITEPQMDSSLEPIS